MGLATLFAIADGIFKVLISSFLITSVLLVSIVLNLFSIFIAILAKHELVHERLDVLHKFNYWQGPPILTSGREGLPKFAMAIYFEKLDNEDIDILNCANDHHSDDEPLV